MTSFKSQTFYLMMKYRHLFQGRLRQETWDEHTSVQAFRELAEQGNRKMADKMPAGVTVQPLSAAGLRAEWLLPQGAGQDKVILYTVGGGYISGSCDDHRLLVARVAQNSGAAVLIFDHRLAPEHPFPAALDDTLAVYRWLLDEQGVRPENIVIMGESAGGGLALAALLAIRDQGLPLPAGGVALSPWTDLTLSGESYRTRARVCISPPGMAQVCSRYYAGENDLTNPWISPLFGDLHGLPPLFINVGDYETMRDDSTRFAEKAKAAGVDVTLVVGEKMIHCYPLLAPMFPEATQAMAQIAAFIRARLRV